MCNPAKAKTCFLLPACAEQTRIIEISRRLVELTRANYRDLLMRTRSALFTAAALAAIALAWFGGRATAPISAPVSGNSANSTSGKVNIATKQSAASLPRTAPTAKKMPLPPPGTPLSQILAELRARSDAGDGEAASRLYHDLARCYSVDARAWVESLRADQLTAQPTSSKTTEATLRAYERTLDMAQQRLAKFTQLKQVCAGLDEAALSTLPATTLRAAQLGDAGARNCYTHRGPLFEMRNLLDNPQWLSDYRANAPSLIEAGLADGDWRMVDMLRYAYSPRGNGLIGALVGPDPQMHYRYLKLFRLGADGPQTDELDRELTLAADRLSADQRSAADAWAQDQLRNFSGKSTTTTPPGWDACALTDE